MEAAEKAVGETAAVGKAGLEMAVGKAAREMEAAEKAVWDTAMVGKAGLEMAAALGVVEGEA